MNSQLPSPLGRNQLAAVLARLGVHHLQAHDGAFVAGFDMDNRGGPLVISYAVHGDGEEILAVRGTTSITYESDDWPLMMGLLNEWHSSHRWPRASIDITKDEGQVLAAVDVFLPVGVSEEQLSAIVEMASSTIAECHSWLIEQHCAAEVRNSDIVSIAELEQWFRRAACVRDH
jgi:hypothetical protein